jgi:SAM-dependent methyltransferase
VIRSLGNWGTHYAGGSEARAQFYLSWMGKYSQVPGEVTLDLGCGDGFVSSAVKEVGGVAVSLDVSHRGGSVNPGLDFLVADATRLPIRGGVVMNVFSSDVYEHVRDQGGFLAESSRVMRVGGRGFLATGNRFFPIDRHTGLPFIDLLPKRVASFWARKAGRRRIYDVYEPSFFGLCRALSRVSGWYAVDFRMFTDFFMSVYPSLSRGGGRWFALVRLLDWVGVLWLVAPKFYAVFGK